MTLNTRELLFFALAFVLPLSLSGAGAESKYAIAYTSWSPLNNDIFLADPDGSNAKHFLPNSQQDFNPSFSRDGNWIIFTSQRNGSANIYRAHLDGSGLEQLTNDPAFNDQAALSPDGSRLAFMSSRSGHAEIWMLDLKTKKTTDIVNHAGGHFRPVWSPDGQWIAFSSDRDSPHPRRPDGFETIQRTEIYLIHPDGTGLKQLTHTGSFAGSPSWSSDGKQIAFYKMSFEDVITISDPRRLRGTSQIATVDVATGQEKILTQGQGEKWSPRFLASSRIGYFSGGPDGGLEFTDGTQGARGEFSDPHWSPDGKKLVFFRDVGQNWPPLVETHSQDPEFRLIRAGIFASFSPSGDRLVFTNGTAAMSHNGLVEASADGSNRWLIFDDQKRSVVAPAWSPTGERIAFGVGGAFQNILGFGVVTSNIATIKPDGTGFKLLTEGERNDNFPSWSPDGRRLVFRTVEKTGKGLRILNTDTGEMKVLTEGKNDNFPFWSPIGDEICFTSDREDNDYEIYTIHADGTGLRRITHIPGNDAHATWSPDGEWLAFATEKQGFKDEMPLHPHNPQSYGELAVIRPDGSDIRILTANPWEDSAPRWAPLPPNHGSR
jgi:TolB protein